MITYDSTNEIIACMINVLFKRQIIKQSKNNKTLNPVSTKVEDTKGKMKSRKSKKDRQNKGQKKKDKMTSNDLQNITEKTADWSTLFCKIRCDSERVSSSCTTCENGRITVQIIYSSVKNRENDSENKVIPNHKQKVLYIEGY